MRSRTKRSALPVTAFFLLLLFLQGMLAGCTNGQNEGLAVTACGKDGVIAQTARDVRPACCEVQAGTFRAKGILCERRGNELIVASVRHVLPEEAPEEQKVSVVFPDAGTFEGRLLYVSELHDLVFFGVSTGDIGAEALSGLRRVRFPDEKTGQPAEGDTVFVLKEDGSVWSGFLQDPELYTEVPGQTVMRCYLTTEPGMSGSAVFDVHGTLIGMVSMGEEGGGMLAVPAPVILETLDSFVYN